MKYPIMVYSIRHNKTRRVYVGVSKQPNQRFRNHISALRSGKHPVEDMQADFDKYGEDYKFEILDVISTCKENKKEFEWQERLNSHIRGIGYNYKDYENRNRVRPTKSHKGELFRIIKKLTDEEAEKLVAFLEIYDRKDNT